MGNSTVNDIMNRAAVEVGLNPNQDPVASSDETFVQLRYLLDSAGQELVKYQQWEVLNMNFSFTTQSGDSGTYDLPSDFAYMIDQTGWDRSNNVSIGGPLSSQDWAYLEGRDLVSQSIYVSFQLNQGKLQLYPQPPPVGLEIDFEYMSNGWLQEAANPDRRHDRVQTGTDLCLLDDLMTIKFLKCKFLEAKGLDASAARLEFENIMGAVSGQDEGAPILNASGSNRGFPYLSPYFSTGDSGYGR